MDYVSFVGFSGAKDSVDGSTDFPTHNIETEPGIVPSSSPRVHLIFVMSLMSLYYSLLRRY